jgi:flagellar biosynthesis/type III secretory pathway chaperone
VSTSWQTITETLRNELQEYGALLGLFADQQANLLRRDATAVLDLANAIEAQVETMQSCREQREQATLIFAGENGQSSSASLRQLLKFFPAEVQPLLQALIDEINHLIHRIRRGARQNQILLSRTVEAHDEALRALRPDLYPKTYSRRGAVGGNTTAHTLQAAG